MGNQALMVDVTPEAQACVILHHSGYRDQFLIASMLNMLSPERIGEASFPVASVQKLLKADDCDVNGRLYVTPKMEFDLLKNGVRTGGVCLSFETRQAPPSADRPACCS